MRVPSVLLAASILSSLSSVAAAETYYVAMGGDDDADGSSGTPWASLQKAADTVAAGDTVIVRAGNYAGFHLTTSGTANLPITFSAEANAVVDADNETTPDGLNLEGASYVLIEGFTVTGVTRAGIRAVLCENVTIRNNRTDQNGVWGILTGFCDDLLIENNECSRSGDEHGIYVSNSGDRPVIRGNRLFSNNANGLHMNGDVSLGGDGVISNALVENNIIWDNGSAGGSGINGDGVQNSVIRNNLLYENHASGISLYQIDGGEPSSGNLIINNTVVQASNGRWALNIQDAATNNRVFNNILLSRHASRGAVDISADSLTGFVSNNNVVIGRFTNDDGNSVLDLAEWRAGTGQDTASLEAAIDDVFVDATGGDYHLSETSPALENGASTDAPATDFEGQGRPQGAGVDIGADERCPDPCGMLVDAGVPPTDSGSPSDTGPSPDSGPEADAGLMANDASSAADADPGRDGGFDRDTGQTGDVDGTTGTNGDAGSAVDEGCGCSANRASGPPWIWLLLLALVPLSVRRLPKLGRSFVLYFAGLCVYVLVVGVPFIGVSVLSVTGSGYLIEALRLRGSDPKDAGRRLERGLLALGFAAAIVFGFAANTRLGSKGAEDIARALQAYRS